MTMLLNVVDYIRRNRVSTTEVADCLGKTGAIPGVVAVNRGHFRVGKVFWAYAWDETNWPVHEQIESVPEGAIVVVDDLGCGGRAVFGDLVAKYLLLYRQAAAVVVTGTLRDAHRLVKENWPIWCAGFNPVGCFNRPPSVPVDADLYQRRRELYTGAVAVCDDTGVVVIPEQVLSAEFLRKLELIEAQEDIWYECVDRRKWSTYRTICLKDYLNQPPVETPMEGVADP